MKNLCISLALIGAIALSSQGAFAAWEGVQSLNPVPYLSYLNPLPYFGIGENKTNFSLNPFTGFKNCNKCKVKKCDECTKVKVNPCPTCRKAFAEPTCNSCDRIYLQPVQPKCPCMIKH
ncbi:TPA: hypothetical protein CPT81_08945 [Candidatus Gastranaerophilales bacterium HUM_20]|jgi:hypothetical protein|nr:MAG: hypothetical protein BHW55_08625 [Candidatus Melainabacteria bacterium 35_41]CDE89330.1 unknown [Clostridium sp. CAG:729]DAB18922.1 MAG TPA: hypothetical protein CPT81_08945 [Candidatus Gastranaerophilales bacterium HUM_20]